MRAEATAECEEMRTQTSAEVYNTRVKVKQECESVSEYMAQMKAALEEVQNVVTTANTQMNKAISGVADAVNSTIEAANQAFPELGKN